MPAEIPGNGVPVNGVAWSDVLGLRQSGGATFKGKVGTSNWYHVPIATPVIVAGVRAKLVQVFVMFQCGSQAAVTNNNADLAGCNITDVHVWDGPTRIQTFGPFKLFGDHRTRLDTSTMHKLPTPVDIHWGIDLAVQVSFTQDEAVTFVSAGADFMLP